MVESTMHASCWGWQESNPCHPDQIGRDTAFAFSPHFVSFSKSVFVDVDLYLSVSMNQSFGKQAHAQGSCPVYTHLSTCAGCVRLCGKRLAGGVCVCVVTHARLRTVMAVRAERLLPTAAPPSGPSWFSLARPGKVTWTHCSSLAPCFFQRFRISFARTFSPRHGQTSALLLSSCVE